MSKMPAESEAKTANPEEAPKTEKKSATKIAPVKRPTASLAERKEQKSKTLQTADEKTSKASIPQLQQKINKTLSPIKGTRAGQLNQPNPQLVQ